MISVDFRLQTLGRLVKNPGSALVLSDVSASALPKCEEGTSEKLVTNPDKAVHLQKGRKIPFVTVILRPFKLAFRKTAVSGQ